MNIENRIKYPPKYKIGQEVVVELDIDEPKTKKKFAIKTNGWISMIMAGGTSENDTYNYGITTDMPGCYHYGEKPFVEIEESNIVLAEGKK